MTNAQAWRRIGSFFVATFLYIVVCTEFFPSWKVVAANPWEELGTRTMFFAWGFFEARRAITEENNDDGVPTEEAKR